MKIVLPLPPSINRYYTQNKYTGRRVKTKEAKSWESEALWMLKKIRKKFRKKEVVVIYEYYFKDNRSDYINRAKITDDIIEKAGIIDNDRQIIEGHIYKRIDKKNPRVEIEIEKI